MSTPPRRSSPLAARRGARLLSLAVALWLAACLVGAQLAGLAHRIEHPHGDPALAWNAHDHPHDHAHDHAHDHDAAHGDHAVDVEVDAAEAHHHAEDAAAHHCAAYDAATLGDGPPLSAAASEPPRATGACLRTAAAVAPAASRWAAFRSRAPPLA